jgi:lipid-A-disaccharide synthase
MADVGADSEVSRDCWAQLGLAPDTELIGLMPGSKKDKLSIGLPFLLGTAEAIHARRPEARFVIPVAPMLSLPQLAQFADAEHNPDIHLFAGAATATLIDADSPLPRLRTTKGVEVILWTTQPAYGLLSQFRLCLTTVGANTAELGSLGIPMMVLLPTQKLEAMKSWDGIPGLLANLPLVGNTFARGINRLVIQQVYKKGRLFAWPNIWARGEIVPELVGRLQPAQVARQAVDYLEHPAKLEAMTQNLRAVRGETGAAAQLADMVLEELDEAVALPLQAPQEWL